MITKALGKALRAGGATGLVVAGTWLAMAVPAHAQVAGNQNQYSLTAEGDGELYSVTNAQLPAATTEEVSPYSSQAANDSSGNSSAFAGLPYPGPVGATIEGTVNGLSGGATPPIPPAPGFVSTTFPGSPKADESQGPYVVKASSSQYQSSAQAGFGLSPNAGAGSDANQQAYSRASVTANPDGTVVATASAGVDGLNIGNILDALNVGSTATLTGDGTHPPVLTADSNLGTFQVLGFKIGVTAQGFDVAGANLPLPTSQILAEVNHLLGSKGIEISVLPAVTGKNPDTGATEYTSASVKVVTVQNAPALGPVTIEYDFGRVTVTAADVAVGGSGTGTAATGGGDTSGATGGGSSNSGSATSSGDSSAATASTGGSAPVDTGGSSAATGNAGLTASTASAGTSAGGGAATTGSDSNGPSLAGTSTGSGPTAPVGGSTGGSVSSGSQLPTSLGSVPTLASAGFQGDSLHGVYLSLVLAAIAAGLGAAVFRHLGVRLTLR